MRKPYIFILGIALGLPGCFDGRLDCVERSSFGSLNYLAILEVDSVHFFLNGIRVCKKEDFQKDSLSMVACYGGIKEQELTFCKESEEQDYLTIFEKGMENCFEPNLQTIKWNVFICAFQFDGMFEKTTELMVDVFYRDSTERILLGTVQPRGRFVNVIPYQDTLKLFSYTEGSILPYFDDFISPSEWTRIGCADGYCVATQPMLKREFCYER